MGLNCTGPLTCGLFSINIAPVFSSYRSLTKCGGKVCVWLEITIVNSKELGFESGFYPNQTVSASCSWVSNLSTPLGVFWGFLFWFGFLGSSTLYKSFSLPQILFPIRLPHKTEQNSPCYTVGPHRSSIPNIALWTCQSQTPQLSLRPTLPSLPTISSFYINSFVFDAEMAICGFSTGWGIGTLNSHFVQGSTVLFWNFKAFT